MSNSDVILIFLIAASSLQILSLSLVILVKRNQKQINYINGLIYFLYGMSHLCDTTYRQGTEYLSPHLLHINTLLVFFLAPVIYIYFMMILREDYQVKMKHYFLILPGIIVLLALIPFYILDAPSKLAIYPFIYNSHNPMKFIDLILRNSRSVIIIISFLLTLRSTFFLWNKRALAHIKIIRRLLLYMAGWVFLAGVYGVAGFTGDVLVYRIASLTGNFLLLLYFLFTCRDPDFFSKVQKESTEIRYLNSRLKSIDKDKVLAQLNSLITQEEIYKESMLTLKTLSRELAITPSQLSELLNSHYCTNFNNYINSHRIDEVKKTLKDHPNVNILQTAFECGFNSKTAFNNAFRKFTNLSPSHYRKNIRSES